MRDFYGTLAAGDCAKAVGYVRDWNAEACEAVSSEIQRSGAPEVQGSFRDGRFSDVLVVKVSGSGGVQSRTNQLRVSPDPDGTLRILPPETR